MKKNAKNHRSLIFFRSRSNVLRNVYYLCITLSSVLRWPSFILLHSKHVHFSMHLLPFLKHSQYFLLQPDFLQLQPSLTSSSIYFRENAMSSFWMISFMASARSRLSLAFLQPLQVHPYIILKLLGYIAALWQSSCNKVLDNRFSSIHNFIRLVTLQSFCPST